LQNLRFPGIRRVHRLRLGFLSREIVDRAVLSLKDAGVPFLFDRVKKLASRRLNDRSVPLVGLLFHPQLKLFSRPAQDIPHRLLSADRLALRCGRTLPVRLCVRCRLEQPEPDKPIQRDTGLRRIGLRALGMAAERRRSRLGPAVGGTRRDGSGPGRLPCGTRTLGDRPRSWQSARPERRRSTRIAAPRRGARWCWSRRSRAIRRTNC
jgi:hypothetical protein